MRKIILILFLSAGLLLSGCLPKRNTSESQKSEKKKDVEETVTVDKKKPEEGSPSESDWKTAGKSKVEETPVESEKQKEEDKKKLKNIYFDFDSARLTEKARDILAENARWMKNNPGKDIVIEGHCDERGTKEYNLALGDKRAEAAKEYLVSLGVSPDRFKTISYGEELPVADGHNEEAWSKNRRCHFLTKD